MKRIALTFSLGISLLWGGTGCIKDQGFEDKEYGTQIDEVKGVAFPEAPKSPVLGSINSQTTPSVVQGPYVTLEQSGGAANNVTVTLQENSALVTTANLTPLPAGTYTVSSLSVVISAGKQLSDEVKITIPNSTLLDPTKTYGVGFTISAVDQGYIIAGNQKNIVIAFTIKNKYDGVYKLKILSTGWAAYGIADGVVGTYPGELNFITVGESSNSTFTTSRKDDLLPAFAGGAGTLGGPTAFGATTAVFYFDKTTDKLIDVKNSTPDDGRGRTLSLNTAVPDSRYDPATKTIYAAFIMKQNGRPNQFFYDTLTYIKAR